MSRQNDYSTSTQNIYLAAALLSQGARISRVDRSDPKRFEFFFAQDDDLDFEQIELDWVNRVLECNAFQFSESLKRLKSIVHSRTTES